jgi:hypothetical protein
MGKDSSRRFRELHRAWRGLVVDDIDGSVLVVNAWKGAISHAFVGPADLVRGALWQLWNGDGGRNESPMPLANHASLEAIASSLQQRVIAPDEVLDSVSLSRYYQGAFWLTVESAEDCALVAAPLLSGVQACLLAHDRPASLNIVVEATGNCDMCALGVLVARVKQCCANCAADSDGPAIQWHVRVSDVANPEDVLKLLEICGSWRCYVVDDTVGYHGAPEEARTRLRSVAAALQRQGAGVQIVLKWDGSSAIHDRLLSWASIGGWTGYNIELNVVSLDRQGDVSILASASVQNATVELDTLVAQLGRSIKTSEPFRSAIASSLVAGAIARHWDRTRSAAYIAPNGRWAKSRAHALLGEFEDEAGLLRRALGPEGRPIKERGASEAHFDGLRGAVSLPNCCSCGYRALCDRYWSPEGDALRTSGRPSELASLAQYFCKVRECAHRIVLDELHSAFQEAGGQPRHHTLIVRDGVPRVYAAHNANNASQEEK